MKKSLSLVSLITISITLAIGFAVAVGWMLHEDLLNRIFPSEVRTKFNTAIALLLSVGALLTLFYQGNAKKSRRIASLLSVLVILIGMITLTEYLFAINIGIDELFVKDDFQAGTIYYPGRMSPLAAIYCCFFGTGLFLFNKEKTANYQFYYLSAIAFASLVMLIVFNFIADIPTFIRPSVHTSVSFIALCVATWFAQPLLHKKISFERKLYTGFMASIGLIIMISIFSAYYSNKRIVTSGWVKHTGEILKEARDILSVSKDIEIGEFAYLIKRDSVYLEYFTIAKNKIPGHINALKKLTDGDTAQQVRIDSLSALLNKRIDFSPNKNGAVEAGQLSDTQLNTEKIRAVITAIQQEAERVLAAREAAYDKSITAFNRAFFVFLASVFILLVIIIFSIRYHNQVNKKAGIALTRYNNELELKVLERTETLASSETRFRSLIENSAEGITLTDEFSNVVYRSPAAAKIAGLLPDENTISRSHPDDLEAIKSKHTELLRKPGVPINFLGRFLHASGHYIWLEGTFTNLLHVKGVNAIVANYRDISNRKKAEEELIKSEKIYKTIASSIPDSVICLLDTEFRYLLIEGDMLEKLGYIKSELLGNRIKDVLPAKIYDDIRMDFEKVLQGETVTRELTRNGYDTVSRFIPLKDEHNTVYNIMTVAIDVTRLKNAQREVAELNRSLEEKIVTRTEQLNKSNQDLEAFSYSISHDLRAPLRAIIGFTTMLEEDYVSQLDDEAMRITTVIKNNTIKMGDLIDDLLAFSRTGRQDIIKAWVDSEELVKEVIDSHLSQAPGRPVEWLIEPLPAVMADLKTLRQVWVNLISNAIKYSGNSASPQIKIGALQQEGEVVFFVKDNGVGFNEKYKDKLFKVFQRLHSPEKFEGTGVGLAIVEKVISKHEGKVWAEAVEGKGATFYFSLPANDKNDIR